MAISSLQIDSGRCFGIHLKNKSHNTDKHTYTHTQNFLLFYFLYAQIMIIKIIIFKYLSTYILPSSCNIFLIFSSSLFLFVFTVKWLKNKVHSLLFEELNLSLIWHPRRANFYQRVIPW